MVAWAPLALAAHDGDEDAEGNSGTVKVRDDDPSDDHEHRNEPQVCGPFWIEGFNMADDEGTLTVREWPNGDVVLESDWTWDGSPPHDHETGDTTGYHFVAGPFELPDGHYKVFVSNGEHHDKMKVFHVSCDEHGEDVPIPFFPSHWALGLGLAGAMGGAFLLLRRRA